MMSRREKKAQKQAFREAKIKEYEALGEFDRHIDDFDLHHSNKVIDEKYKYESRHTIFGKLILKFLRYIFFPILGFWYHSYRVYGKRNVRELKNKSVITVSNHVFALDCVIISTVFRRKKYNIVSLSNNLTIRGLALLIRFFGAIPLADTIGGQRNFVKYIKKVLSTRSMLHIMPEGSLWEGYDKIRPFKRGAFNIAVRNNTPVMPMCFVFRKRNKLSKFLFPGRLNVNLLLAPAIYPDNSLPRQEAISKLTEEVHEAVCIMNKTKKPIYKTK